MKANISPVVRYQDARAAIDWLTRAFGFEVQAKFEGPDGSIAHAELRSGTGVINVNSVAPRRPGNPWSAIRQGLYVNIDAVDAHYEQARRADARIEAPPRDMDYGAREYTVRDLDGHLWSFGTYVMNSREGAADVFPELRYPSGSAAVAWLARAFGFAPLIEVPGPDGTPIHAEMQLEGGVIFMNLSPGDEGFVEGLRQAASVYADDPDARFAVATSAGASVVHPPFTTHYGARSCWVRDPEGFLWGFSTYRPSERPASRS